MDACVACAVPSSNTFIRVCVMAQTDLPLSSISTRREYLIAYCRCPLCQSVNLECSYCSHQPSPACIDCYYCQVRQRHEHPENWHGLSFAQCAAGHKWDYCGCCKRRIFGTPEPYTDHECEAKLRREIRITQLEIRHYVKGADAMKRREEALRRQLLRIKEKLE